MSSMSILQKVQRRIAMRKLYREKIKNDIINLLSIKPYDTESYGPTDDELDAGSTDTQTHIQYSYRHYYTEFNKMLNILISNTKRKTRTAAIAMLDELKTIDPNNINISFRELMADIRHVFEINTKCFKLISDVFIGLNVRHPLYELFSHMDKLARINPHNLKLLIRDFKKTQFEYVSEYISEEDAKKMSLIELVEFEENRTV